MLNTAEIVEMLRGLQTDANTPLATSVVMRIAADEIERLRMELAACCRDGGAGAHTAGPTEHFIPEAL